MNCGVDVPRADDDTDIHALDIYEAFVLDLLVHERFDNLDCIADAARANKTKFSGGMWQLHIFYFGLQKPLGHATDDDWREHLEKLSHWVAAKPNSITARVALANSYLGYAWFARGNGFSNTVTESGWSLFAERAKRAEDILQQASVLSTKCPEAYLAMQGVAQAEGWDISRVTELYRQAIAFDPTYYYFYRVQANLLSPKWYGEEGDSERFAEDAANHMGGTDGDVLYFEIAANMVCRCNKEAQLKLMSWSRIQKGFAELERRSGSSLINLNLLAYMAVKQMDPIVANQAFVRIGDSWNEDTWYKKSFFDSYKQWAAQGATEAALQKSIHDAADADMQTPEGIRLKESFEKKFATEIKQCIESGAGDLGRFDLLVALGGGGMLQEIRAEPNTKVGLCMLRISRDNLEPPSHAPFWLKIEIDPSKRMSASMN